jgi:hypothetical protein
MMVKFVLLLLVTSLIALSAIVIDASTFTPYIPRKSKTFLRTQQSIFLCPSQTSTFKCNLNENAQPSRKFGQSVGIGDGIHRIRQRRNRQARIIASSQSQTLLPCIFNRVIPRGGSADDLNEIVLDKSTIAPKSNIRMYGWCLFVVLVWITTGTIFYSKFNSWPLPQSFFYAVDAGMSIGFCTDVMETRVGSRAFTIVFILLGASCVGGALLLFIKDIMEGAVVLRNDAFEQLLAAHAAKRYEKKGKLTHEQFRMLVEEWTQKHIGDETFHKLCRRFDPCDNGTISSQKFVQRCHEMATLLNTDGPLYSDRFIVRKAAQVREFMRESVDITHRIFTVFIIWVSVGICKLHAKTMLMLSFLNSCTQFFSNSLVLFIIELSIFLYLCTIYRVGTYKTRLGFDNKYTLCNFSFGHWWSHGP